MNFHSTPNQLDWGVYFNQIFENIYIAIHSKAFFRIVSGYFPESIYRKRAIDYFYRWGSENTWNALRFYVRDLLFVRTVCLKHLRFCPSYYGDQKDSLRQCKEMYTYGLDFVSHISPMYVYVRKKVCMYLKNICMYIPSLKKEHFKIKKYICKMFSKFCGDCV